jgi:hypothetical protein
MAGALLFKSLVGQVNTVIHAMGILVSLPYVLDEDERVEHLSLGAGTKRRSTGSEDRLHDLETDRKVAEFKFITWRAGAELVRQNGVFADLYKLARAERPERFSRVLYVVGKKEPLAFLQGNRKLSSVRGNTRSAAFRYLDSQGFGTVGQYFESLGGPNGLVKVVDLRGEVGVPAFAGSGFTPVLQARSQARRQGQGCWSHQRRLSRAPRLPDAGCPGGEPGHGTRQLRARRAGWAALSRKGTKHHEAPCGAGPNVPTRERSRPGL